MLSWIINHKNLHPKIKDQNKCIKTNKVNAIVTKTGPDQ